MRYLLLLLQFFLLFGYSVKAQRLLGVATGNNTLMQGMYINPACLGGFNENYIITVFSANALIDNDLGTITSITKLIGSTKKTNGDKIFRYSGNSKFSMLAPMIEIQGPGIIKSITPQHTLAFTTRLRVFNQFYNFDKLLFDAALNFLNEGSVSANMKNFKWTVHSWSEAGLSYGGVLVDNDKNRFKVGVRVNLLGGIGYIGLDGKSLNLKYTTGVDSMAADNVDLRFTSSMYGSDDNISSSQILGNVFGGSGRGFGIDAGMIYLSRGGNNSDEQSYKFALSLSVTDVGAITYNTMASSAFTGSGYISSSGLSANAKNFANLNQYLISRGFKNTAAIKPDIVYLPTSVIGSIDYHVKNNLFGNLMMTTNIAGDYNLGNKYFSQLTFTPRYESKAITIGIPITYNTLVKNLRVGFGVRVMSFFLGSDDALLFFMSRQYGFNFYAGGYVVIHKKR